MVGTPGLGDEQIAGAALARVDSDAANHYASDVEGKAQRGGQL